ncbi:hypothetical protein EUGRSUZ_H05147 [Eucalyptus grandis]|uniref:Uncharacterized protein n=2 Tax=Eucalyptus grandis TaxID=71139 RepID=A0ACC3JYX8_EUCGR|nr:hypothetical protein EUGRSUZ_H05147 [Eucalyptus grandis]
MSSFPKQPYPPCGDGMCNDPKGNRMTWPKLVGQNGEKAKAVIEKDNPTVTAVLIVKGKEAGFGDYCCNRVYVWIDEKGNVCEIPMVG